MAGRLGQSRHYGSSFVLYVYVLLGGVTPTTETSTKSEMERETWANLGGWARLGLARLGLARLGTCARICVQSSRAHKPHHTNQIEALKTQRHMRAR